MISVVIPTLDEEQFLAATLASVEDPLVEEVILADGGSRDATVDIARAAGVRLVRGTPGRALQMNSGARLARGEVLLFLHGDSTLPEGFGESIREALRDPRVVAGRFDVELSGGRRSLRLIEFMINQRSRLSGIATGDQGIFVRRQVFEELDGFADLPLMEDVEFSGRVRKIGRMAPLRARVRTSSRRWEDNGVARTILLMWSLRLAYFLGVPARRLARIYYPERG